MMGFIIWTVAAVIFAAIGISSWKSKEAVGFFTGIKPPTVKNVTGYNHAVSMLWFVSAAALELIGIPTAFLEQNSAGFVFVILGVVILVIGMMTAYLKIEKKYARWQ